MAASERISFPTLQQMESARGKTVTWLLAHKDHADADNCLEWPYSKMRFGYGHLNVERKFYPAHRIMCWLRYGEPSDKELVAAHSCNNPGCVNPNHLRWATSAENSQDMLDAGRARTGEKHLMTFLSERDVRAIRHLHGKGVVQRRLAEAFDVSPQRINEIVKFKSWKHVNDGPGNSGLLHSVPR